MCLNIPDRNKSFCSVRYGLFQSANTPVPSVWSAGVWEGDYIVWTSQTDRCGIRWNCGSSSLFATQCVLIVLPSFASSSSSSSLLLCALLYLFSFPTKQLSCFARHFQLIPWDSKWQRPDEVFKCQVLEEMKNIDIGLQVIRSWDRFDIQ